MPDDHAARRNAAATARAATAHAATARAATTTRPSESMAAATRHRVEADAYTLRERERAQMALDRVGASVDSLSFTDATSFPGFATLSLLAQLPEYRTMHETLADEAVRAWGSVISSSEDDAHADRITEIEAEMDRVDLLAIVRQVVIHDQAYGGAHVYFKLHDDEYQRHLPMLMQPYSIPRGSFVGLRVVEPYWVTPNDYNSIDPTASDFYTPNSWWLLGVECHASRLQTIISRPVADMLKPAYSFRGTSMTQLAQPYVDNWLRTRQSVSDTVKQFSISGIATDLEQTLLPGGSMDLAARASLINVYRDNRNILFLDKDTEEFFQINTPLVGLADLQAQSQEQMASVCHIPLVKLLGVTPTGLNASSDGEIRIFYDYVRGYQRNTLEPLIRNVIRAIQLSLYGDIDDQIDWQWTPLLELTSLEQSELRQRNAETDARYIETGVVTPAQVAATLNDDELSRYGGLLGDELLDNIPDDDIAGITEHLRAMATEPTATGPTATPTEPTATPTAQPTTAQPTTAQPTTAQPTTPLDPVRVQTVTGGGF